nr:uncharacterized protein LOC113813923 [Penaeus vannamei]
MFTCQPPAKQFSSLRSVLYIDGYMQILVFSCEELTPMSLRHESQKSLGYQFRISHNLVSSIIPEVCKAIYQVLHEQYLKAPSTERDWKQVAEEYYKQWNFPNCIGALDGKRVLIAKPRNSGSEFYDYKGHFSVIMMALVDANYKFMYVDVGASGRASDSGVWDRCTLKESIEANILNIPPSSTLPVSNKQCPCVIVGDDAFPLKNYLMKPCPGRDLSEGKFIFNYRPSRARRTSENVFGIWPSRFQVFKDPINTSPENVKLIVLATCVSHNYLRIHSMKTYSPPEFLESAPSKWTAETRPQQLC